jgi:hypothetical protein
MIRADDPTAAAPPDALVVTSIAGADHPILRTLAEGCRARRLSFLAGVTFLNLADQAKTGFRFARLCPTRHYARKTIGYLRAIADGARTILETDDDNIPLPAFFAPRARARRVASASGGDWINVYRLFTERTVWPRGLPLDAVAAATPAYESLATIAADCPIQQGLADDNPDVDAVYRLVMPLPLAFAAGRRVALGRGAWCPFNSQNTFWFRAAFPLLYLPAYCSFRMTDIWRSLVAQRIAWAQGWSILFESPTVRQERNDHNLMRDFADEVPGYLRNREIARRLDGLAIAPGAAAMGRNLRLCYETLVAMEAVGRSELELLDAWLDDLARLAPDCLGG